MNKLGELSNEELLARLRAHVGKGHVWQAGLIAYLAEVDARRLDREYACTSMWDFCIRKLGMSESEANRRIAAARVVQAFPIVLGFLARGDVHLCALYALRKHLSDENHEELLRAATGKSTSDVEALIAARHPRPDVPSCIAQVQPQEPLPVAASAPPSGAPSASAAVLVPPTPDPRPRIEPLSATRYRIELTASAEIRSKLERVRDLMRHRNPTGDLEIILEASLDSLLAKLEKERLGKTSRPRKAKTEAHTPVPEDVKVTPCIEHAGGSEYRDAKAEGLTAPAPTNANANANAIDANANDANANANANANEAVANDAIAAAHAKTKPRRGYISNETRRQVFARDGERCTYVDAEGHRCPARGHLELDHVHPRALGGSDTAENLRVRCRRHNNLYAEQVFGRAHVEGRIRFRQRKSAAPRMDERIHFRHGKSAAAPSPVFETAARALRHLGFREPEVKRALAILATTLDAETATIETVIREALGVLT